MKIAVAGGTGLAGRHTLQAVRRVGRDAVLLARSTGLDLTTKAGLAGALDGVDAVIDTTNTPRVVKTLGPGRRQLHAGGLVAGGGDQPPGEVGGLTAKAAHLAGAEPGLAAGRSLGLAGGGGQPVVHISLTHGPLCSQLTQTGRVTLSDRTLVQTTGDQRQERTLTSDAEVLAAYRTWFGIVLDRVPGRPADPAPAASPPARSR